MIDEARIYRAINEVLRDSMLSKEQRAAYKEAFDRLRAELLSTARDYAAGQEWVPRRLSNPLNNKKVGVRVIDRVTDLSVKYHIKDKNDASTLRTCRRTEFDIWVTKYDAYLRGM